MGTLRGTHPGGISRKEHFNVKKRKERKKESEEGNSFTLLLA